MNAIFLGFMMTFCFTFSFIPQCLKMLRNKSCKDVSIYMLALQVIGYFCGVVFLEVQKINNILLQLNYHAGLFVAVVTCTVWVWCNNNDK